MRFPEDTTKTFCEVWDCEDDFLADYKDSSIYASEVNRITDVEARLLYGLLYARHGNSAIANWDENQFKYKVFTVIFQYGPAWSKKLDIQTKIRALTDEQIVLGSKAVNAHAYAMGNDTVEADTDPTQIDQKSSTVYSKSPLEGYATLLSLIQNDVTGEFLDKFKPLFAKFVKTKPVVYVTELEEDDDE